MTSPHGWIVPLPSGAKARCGGPGMCSICQTELKELRARDPFNTHAQPRSGETYKNGSLTVVISDKPRIVGHVRFDFVSYVGHLPAFEAAQMSEFMNGATAAMRLATFLEHYKLVEDAEGALSA